MRLTWQTIKTTFWAISFSALLSVSARAELTVLAPSEPPTNYMQYGELLGTTVDIAKELLKRTGHDVAIQMQPWSRIYETALHEKNIMVLTVGKTAEREKHGFHFLGPVMSRTHAIYKRHDSPLSPSSIKEIVRNNFPVGAVRDDWRAHELLTAGVKLDISNNPDLNIRKLQTNRFDLIVCSDIEAQPLLQKYNLSEDYITKAITIKEAPSYIMFSKNTDPQILIQMESAFKALQQTEFFSSIARKHTKTLGYSLVYSPQKGFYRKEVN